MRKIITIDKGIEYIKREIKVSEFRLKENNFNLLTKVSEGLNMENMFLVKREFRSLHKKVTSKDVFDYFETLGALEIKKILLKHLQSEKLSEEDIEKLKKYFWFSTYEEYVPFSPFDKNNCLYIDIVLAYYSVKFRKDEKEVLNEINQQYAIFSNSNSDRIEYLQYVLSINNMVINDAEAQKLEEKIKELGEKGRNCLNLIQIFQIKRELSKIKKEILHDIFSCRMYIKYSEEIKLRQILEKYNNKEQLSKEEIETIKELLDVDSYRAHAVNSLLRDMGSIKTMTDIYSIFNEEEIIELKKISKLGKTSKN